MKSTKFAKLPTIFVCTASLLAVPLDTSAAVSHNKSALAPLTQRNEVDLTSYVNPFIGTEGYGNTFPGPTMPFGMIQWSPDTTSNGFYKYHDRAIRGFSLTHLSGAGCPTYADISFLPVVGEIKSSPATNLSDYTATFSHGNERATPGYYSAKLDSGVQVDLSVTARTGFGVFSYPPSQQANLFINAGGSATGNTISSVDVVSDKEVIGSATSGGFCGSNTSYTIYFAAEFDRPFASVGTWNAATVNPHLRSSKAKQAGAMLTFDTALQPVVKAKVGISFVSIQNARLNLKTENKGWDSAAVRRQASETWNHWLNRIQVEGGSHDQKEIFYTALYHALISPNVFNDVNGDYVGFDHRIHIARGYTHYTNISDWDTYRTLVQLQALLAPRETSDMMQSLVVDAGQSGWLPKWPLANDATGVMGGDNPVALISTAYAFGAKNFDTGTALRFMLKAATQPGNGIHGSRERPRLADYLQRGYVPIYSLGLDNEIDGPASVTLEYANDDFALAQFTQALGDVKNRRALMRRAQNWQNLFDAEIGFIRPRQVNGVFLKGFDAEALLPHSEVSWEKGNQAGFQEGGTWQYTWMVPYNYRGLFQSIGGHAEVVRRLDKFFTRLSGWGTPYFNIANEPSFVAPYAYTFAGSPSRTQRVVRRIMTETFNATPSGLPGNDDLGATSAWYIWSAIGLYPAIPGVGGFVISNPSFSSVAIRLRDTGFLARGQTRLVGSGGEIRIEAQEPTKYSYVHSLTVNGKPHTRAWLPIETVKGGLTTIRFILTDNPESKWASSASDAPPSFSEGQSQAIAFIYGEDSIVMHRGETATFLIGIQPMTRAPIIVRWEAHAPSGLKLLPSSGMARVYENEQPRVVVQVTSSDEIAPGTYTIPITFQASGARGISPSTLPETILEVQISSAGAK